MTDDPIPALPPCARKDCGHPPDWHRLRDEQNVGPTDPEARFACYGRDVMVGGPPTGSCDCPDYLRPSS